MKSNSLKATVTKFEGKMAILKTEDGQELRWPLTQIPEDTKEGATVELVMQTEAGQKQLAKKMLTELLSPEQD